MERVERQPGVVGKGIAAGSLLLNGVMAVQLVRIWITLCRDASLAPLAAGDVYPDEAARTQTPLVSIILPARNEEQDIGRCVRSLLDQDYPNIELIVVDDRSTDRTADIVRAVA